MKRRQAIGVLSAGLVTLAVEPIFALATEEEVEQAIRRKFGDKPIRAANVSLKLPKLAESGNSVPLSVTIQPPTPLRVLAASIFASRNPRPLIATIMFGPRAGKANFTTNIRLNGTQQVIAIAELSDGSLCRTQSEVLVTVGACDALQARY
jgi:sulfur-oxidizing protein SoxY